MKKEKIARIEEKIRSVFDQEYQIIKMLGNGGMGCVFHVQSNAIETADFALKVLDKEAYFDNKLDFMREADVMKGLDHPGIPKIIEVTEDQEYVYMVQEYIRGESLSLIIRKCGKIREEYLKIWMKSIAATFDYLHQQGLIHRDIKPDNMMLTDDCEIKIIDFGLARKKEQIDQADKNVFGTLSFTAPERFTKKVGTVQTDIYGFGVTMYYVTTGKKPENMKTSPFESYAIMEKKLNETAPQEITQILMKAIAVKPHLRYSSFEEILGDLASGNQIKDVEFEERQIQASNVLLILAMLFLIALISAY
ncbi:MAG: serine/threonine-protein kinase [Acetobacterium sp.]|nr:serine/threonine-protein kinase [Acetobacterium sp.]